MQSQLDALEEGTWPKLVAYTMDYMVVAGGGGAGSSRSGGGGAGGFRESSGANTGCYTASPLGGGVTGFTLEEGTYSITVGGGGTGQPFGSPPGCAATKGSNSVLATPTPITSTGGGAPSPSGPVRDGGSGAGARSSPGTGSGNTPPVSPAQGFGGGFGLDNAGGGTGFKAAGSGGGATAVGGTTTLGPPGGACTVNPQAARSGGAGATTSITGSPTAYAGGGGGAIEFGLGGCVTPSMSGNLGGAGGGGNGGASPANGTSGTVITGTAGGANTGGGGGDGSEAGPISNPPGASSGKAGGSGIVVTRFPSAATVAVSPGTNAVSTAPCGAKVATFTVSGTLTIS